MGLNRNSFFLILLLSCVASAQDLSSQLEKRWPDRELLGWSDPGKVSTVQFSSACGIDIEARLHANNTYNSIVFVLKNGTGSSFYLDTDNATILFDRTIKRLARWQKYEGSRVLQPFAELVGYQVLAKTEFKNASNLSFELPIQQLPEGKLCKLSVTFSRNTDMSGQTARQENAVLSEIEMSLGIGAVLSRSSKLGKISESGALTDLSLYGYRRQNLGAFVSITADILNSADRMLIAPLRGGTIGDNSISLATYFLGLSYRIKPVRPFYINYDLGFGFTKVSYEKTNKKDGTQKFNETYMHRLNFNYKFRDLSSGVAQGDAKHVAGLSFIQIQYPDKQVGAVSFGGLTTGAMLFYNYGF